MQAKTLFLEIRKLLPLALLLVSASIIAVPSYRIAPTVVLHRTLMMLECLWIVGWMVRNRYVSKTLQETVEAVTVADPKRRLPIIDQLATAVGLAAVLVLAF